MRRQTLLLNSCFLLLSVGCASSRVNQLEDQNRTLQQRIAKLDRDNTALAAKRAEQMAIEERTRADRAPREGYPPPSIWGNPVVPPPYVGFIGQSPFGFAETGNEARSAKFVNDGDSARYSLRVWIGAEEVGFTEGSDVYQAVVETSRGPQPKSVLAPFEESRHIVNIGEHDIRVARYSGPDPVLQYVETCIWHAVDLDKNVFPRGEFHFNGGICRKFSPPN